MSTTKEGNKTEPHIRVSESTKKKLDSVAPHLMKKLGKKDVSYEEIVSFLANEFIEESKK